MSRETHAQTSLAANFVYNTIYQILNIILPLVTVPYVSRTLGTESLGRYSYTFTVASYFGIFAYLGFENYGNRLIAQNRNDQRRLDRMFSGAFYFQMIAGFLAAGCYVIYLIFFCREDRFVAMIQIVYIVGQVCNISWFYFGLEKFRKTAVYSMFIRLLSFIAILIYVKNSTDLAVYTFICAISTLCTSLIMWPELYKYVNFVKVPFRDILYHARGCLLLFFPVLVISIYRSMDKLMLGKISTMTEVALYTNADKIVEIPYGIITALGVVMLPRMTNLVASGKEKMSRKYIEKSMRFMMFLACGMAFGMMGVGKTFAPIFFGNEFASCGKLIMIIAPMVIIRACANVVRTQYLLPNRRDIDYIVSLLIGVVINLAVNAALIPVWQAEGAAVGTLLAESFVAFYQIFICRKEIPVARYTFRNWFFVLTGFVMFMEVYTIGEICLTSLITLMIQIITGGFFYLAMAGGYLWIEEQAFIINILRKERKRGQKRNF